MSWHSGCSAWLRRYRGALADWVRHPHATLRRQLAPAYERVLRRGIDAGPTHVAIIQDGNRRYARTRGDDAPEGHRAGADTSEQVLQWCLDLGIEELTLYAFSTENFARPPAEREPLFDLLASKLSELADSEEIHDHEVAIRAIGDRDRLPDRVQAAIDEAESKTAGYDRFRLNVALAYGGRNQLLRAAREVTAAVEAGELAPEEIDVEAVEARLYERPIRDVDLIIRTGGDERTSNFLPWHANGNEAAVYFCAPYWPAFSRIDFLRAIRTYEARAASWQEATADRAVALLRAVAAVELEEARVVADRLRDRLPQPGKQAVVDEFGPNRSEGSDSPSTSPRTDGGDPSDPPS